ncbi:MULTISPECIES: DMT family transporter [Halomonadaceae]|uniref:Glutamate/phenylalanine/leucine/valine/L-tryptophan dehydrogenase C-terminal domain-containing protein n=1 Tax=Modicisalibacter zincidurans TaxID=1178777 RepID=A0ABP9RER7_9GAMM|nr:MULTISPECIES: DMT family transporter [Halomonas]
MCWCSLAALENQIDDANVGQVRAKSILEIANGPITANADATLEERGVTVLPDVLANAGPGSWLGNAFAVMAALAMASNFTLCRTRPGVDMTPMLVLSGLLVAAAAWLAGLAAGDAVVVPTAAQAGYLALLCLVLLPLGFTLIQRGPLYLTAADVSLLMLLETVTGTLWVWWLLGETPAPLAFVGGALVVGTLMTKGLLDRRRERAASGPARGEAAGDSC